VNTRSFDVLADDLSAHDMLGDEVRDALGIHPIIQSGRTSRSRQGGKPAPEHARRIRGEDLSHQDVGALGASAEAALPHQLGVLSRTMRVQHGPERLAERGGTAAIAALGAAADQDLETTDH